MPRKGGVQRGPTVVGLAPLEGRVGAIPSGWIADKWSREGMMVVFFVGIGLSAVAAALADDLFQKSYTIETPIEMLFVQRDGVWNV